MRKMTSEMHSAKRETVEILIFYFLFNFIPWDQEVASQKLVEQNELLGFDRKKFSFALI